MDRMQLAQMIGGGGGPVDINRARPPINMPPPAAPQVMTQAQQMNRQRQQPMGPGPMQQIGDTLQQALLQRAMQQKGAANRAGMNSDFGPQGISYQDWMSMR